MSYTAWLQSDERMATVHHEATTGGAQSAPVHALTEPTVRELNDALCVTNNAKLLLSSPPWPFPEPTPVPVSWLRRLWERIVGRVEEEE